MKMGDLFCLVFFVLCIYIYIYPYNLVIPFIFLCYLDCLFPLHAYIFLLITADTHTPPPPPFLHCASFFMLMSRLCFLFLLSCLEEALVLMNYAHLLCKVIWIGDVHVSLSLFFFEMPNILLQILQFYRINSTLSSRSGKAASSHPWRHLESHHDRADSWCIVRCLWSWTLSLEQSQIRHT